MHVTYYLASRLSGAIFLLCIATHAFAAAELALYVFKDNAAGSGLTVVLDGEAEQTTGVDGAVYFDMTPGTHSLQILEGGNPLHSFRFNYALGQYTDISVALSAGDPQVSIESYYATETAAVRAQAPRGVLAGRVTAFGTPVAGAQITVEGEDVQVWTDAAGRYRLELPRGAYNLEITHPDYRSRSISALRLVANVGRSADFGLTQDAAAVMEEVVVVGAYRPEGMELVERDTTNVVDTLGIEDLARFGDTDVAAAVIRLPSVTVQDGKFVFIRGLGGRYVTTTLNGATLPSTDPSKRTVPLDLFPSNIVSQLDIKKTFISPMPGESTGGNLVINTRTFPDARAGRISIASDATLGVTGRKVFNDPTDGGFDWVGWDAGEREEPIAVTAVAQALSLGTVTDTSSGATFEINDTLERELRRLGAILISENLDLDKATAYPDASVGANYGDLFAIGPADLGIFAAVNYKNGWSQKDDGIINTYSPGQTSAEVGPQLDILKFKEYANDIDISGLFSVGLAIGDHTFEANTILSRATQSKVTRTIGQEGDEFNSTMRHTIDWVERQFLSWQLRGSHFLNEAGTLQFDWQGTLSQAKRVAPDRREVRFDADPDLTAPQDLLDGFDIEQPNDRQPFALNGFLLEANQLLRRYDDLTDDNIDVSGALSYEFIATADTEFNMEVGFSVIHRERDSDSSSYGFNIEQALVDLVRSPKALVSEVIREDTITGSNNTGFSFADKTLASDSYEAELDLNSIYISGDYLFNTDYQLIAGIRFEDYQQTTDTFSLSGAQAAVTSNIDETAMLPSLGFNWFYREDHQFRFAIYKTVSRPDFKETSNATFYDTEFDFRVRGNPNLELSEVTNYDARWEWYFADRQSFSLALFYKDLETPIERVVQPASGTAGNSRTFRNAESAELYGVEVEGRKDFALSDDLSQSVFIFVNASVIESEASLADGAKRKLQGQPDYTFNVVLGYDDLVRDQELTVLLNQSGKSIKDVGIAGRPNVIEEPRLDLKVNYKYQFTDDFLLHASAENLLNEAVEYTQGGEIFQSYKEGVQFKLGIDWSF
ncbi:MAG: TonB-dependent receptor [Gammaproteobacteria bacterium]|nr:TonB-dependent receptor [Gammaproteobacteria bacterium]